MKNLRDLAEFRAESLGPKLPDSCQVNPQVYQAELAFWLATQLASRGIATSYPASEDWGWYVEYTTATGADFAVHCRNVDGARDRWFLQLRRFARKLFGRDMPDYEDAAPLVSAIQRLLTESEAVADLDWRYPEHAA